jgi:hypothetical protein
MSDTNDTRLSGTTVLRGPRGGTTTVTRTGMVKKNLWLPREMAERLREEAYRLRLPEAELMRRALAGFFERRRDDACINSYAKA